MNRILFESDEIRDGVATFGGDRAEHVMNVLHGEVGQVLKTGEINGRIGTGEIIECSNARVFESGNNGPVIKLRCRHQEESLRPWVDLILAPPRPRVMKRLLPQLAALGVGETPLRQRLEAMVRAGALETAPGPRGTCYRAVGGEEV